MIISIIRDICDAMETGNNGIFLCSTSGARNTAGGFQAKKLNQFFYIIKKLHSHHFKKKKIRISVGRVKRHSWIDVSSPRRFLHALLRYHWLLWKQDEVPGIPFSGWEPGLRYRILVPRTRLLYSAESVSGECRDRNWGYPAPLGL